MAERPDSAILADQPHDCRSQLVFGHETGQFQVGPNGAEIAQYTGAQKPWNLEIFQRRLQAAGMSDRADDFVQASGALSVLCYREEIEAGLRTPGFGGFQLLDLQDFPGQGTALVGILDAFMHSKGLITPEAWRQFCGPVVPLAKMSSYTWTQSQTFQAEVLVAQYGPEDLSRTPVLWQVVDELGTVVTQGELPPRDLPQGTLVSCGNVTLPLKDLAVPARYDLKLTLGQTGFHNRYPLWVYPDQVETSVPDSVVICSAWDRDTQSLLAAGRTILLLPTPRDTPGVEGFFASDFWCYPMFRRICEGNKKEVAPGTLGLLIDARHPALAHFPTDTHTHWQWWDLIMDSKAMVLDVTPASYHPIVQTIDNFERNHRLGVLFEARVGRGSLLVCSLDLLNKQGSPVARQMLYSLLYYTRSGLVAEETLSWDTLDRLFSGRGRSQRDSQGDYNEFFDREDN